MYGINIDGKLALWDDTAYGQGVFRGNLNYVRGQRTDGIDLYHMMPVNATLALDHTLGNWNTTFEVQLVAAKTLVNEVRNELGNLGLRAAQLPHQLSAGPDEHRLWRR